MTDMQFVDYGAGGPAEVLKLARCDRPVPGEAQVLIEVAYAGVNRPDCAQRLGRYPPPPGASPILGLEVSGHVVAVGANTPRWGIGDAVCALVPGGGYAEFCVVPADHCLPIPTGLTLAQAAALPETCFTVWDNVFVRAALQPGETFLVHGGSGGIGLTAIHMASAFGARVMTTVGSADKLAFCTQAGADLAINYHDQDFVEAASSFTEGKGFDVILDMVAGPYLDRDLDALALDGRIALIAFMGGALATVDVVKILRKRATLTGSMLRPRSVAYKTRLARALEEQWWPRLTDTRLQPVLHRVFPMAEAAQAHTLMESSAHTGKIVLAVSEVAQNASVR